MCFVLFVLLICMKNVKKAIALKYPQGADCPFIVAKGKGELAEKIVQIASEKNIHIEENIPLVDLLDVQEVGDAVPEETWIALSKIFAFVLENSKKVGE